MRVVLSLLVVCFAVVATKSANADFISFTQNPTTNSSDWNNFVTGFGQVNSNVDFDAMPVGPLQSNFYQASDGVTFSTVGDVDTVVFGAGPGQANTGSAPGEGSHAASNYLEDGIDGSELTISFDTGVFGAGFFTVDYFNPNQNNFLELEAFTGVDGTGTSLGTATSVAMNFQQNRLYFMGVGSSEGDIRSIVFRNPSDSVGDILGIDDIVFAPVPEPSASILIAISSALVLRRRKRVGN